jgi:hypothetical protein
MRSDPLTHKKEVLVKWRGYPKSDATWEPYDNLKEDGLGTELNDLERLSRLDSYLFQVRFSNTKGHPQLYRHFSRFMKTARSHYHTDGIHIAGNSELVLRMTPSEVPRFTESFRAFMRMMSPAECTHAILWPISGTEGGLCSAYPTIR